MAIKYSSSAPAGWGIDDTGHFIKVPDGYVNVGGVYQPPATAVPPTPTPPSAPVSQYPSSTQTVTGNIDMGKYGNNVALMEQEYDNVKPIYGTSATGTITITGYTGTPIPKTTMIGPGGTRIVVRTDNKTGKYRTASEMQAQGYQMEKAPGVSVGGGIVAPGAVDLSARPMLRTSSGQTISPQDPNYDAYRQSPGVTEISTTPTASITPTTPAVPPTSTDSGIDQTGWTDSMKQMYDAMAGYVKNITSRGQIVNPDIKIDDAMIKRFTEQAKTELQPYYGQLFAQGEADLKTASESIAKGYEKNVRDIGLTYGGKLEQTQEDLAARGLGLGQYRQQQEQKIQTAAERAIQDAADAAARAAQETGTTGERLLGSTHMAGYTPTIQTGQTLQLGTPGQYGLTGGTGSRSLFTGTAGTTGTQQAGQLSAEEMRKQELISNERGLRAVNYL